MQQKECKGMVGGIQKFSTEDGPGIRTTVFLKGCALSCLWCHNPELIRPKCEVLQNLSRCVHCGECLKTCPENAIFVAGQEIRINRERCVDCLACAEVCYSGSIRAAARAMSVEEVMEEVRKDRKFYDTTKGGVTISGGELLSQFDFSFALAKACFEQGISVAIDTSGYGAYHHVLALAEISDYILYDMKAIVDAVHQKVTGVSNHLILSNLQKLCQNEKIRNKIMMRMPLIHGINDTEEMIDKTAAFYRENRLENVTLLPYHEMGISKYRELGREPTVFESPDDKRIDEITEKFRKIGMKVEALKYTG